MNNQIRNTIIALIISTPLSVLLVYAQWDYIFIDFSEFIFLFNKWHWFKMTIILTAITYLSSYAIIWFNVYYDKTIKVNETSIIYAVCVMPVGLLLFYPGTESLNKFSDTTATISILILYLIHGFGMKIFLTNLIHLTDNK